MIRFSLFICILFCLTILAPAIMPSIATGANPSYSAKALPDTLPFFEGADYDPAIPHPNDFLQEPLGQWPHRYHELIAYVKALEESSDRVVVEKYAESFEGRPLFNIFISTPENIKNREKIREGMARLTDPGNTSATDRDSLLSHLPAVARMAYSIHGDELSGTDAGLLLAYHLAAGRDQLTMKLLENVMIIIDVCENPDGRERFLSMLQTYQSHVPNFDKYALQHEGVWPWGRTNHYLFDLNRDWILATQPETIGRLKTMVDWNPQLVVDAHEMWADATFLMSPPREPINYNIPRKVLDWYKIYQADQAAAFDERGWPYYSGEWNEQWYPGYGSAWPTYFGAVGILYEQAGVDGMLVKQRNNYLLTFHESVNHQFTSSLANLETTADNRRTLLEDFCAMRKDIVSRASKSGLTFIFAPDKDEVKIQRFIESLLVQGIKVRRATNEFTVSTCTDIYHQTHKSKVFPAGTYVVSTAQTQGALIKAILEFDPHLNIEFLNEERREVEKNDDSRLYEMTAWSLPQAYDLDAYYTTSKFTLRGDEDVQSVQTIEGRVFNPKAQFGYLIDMVGEKTYQILNRLFGEELIVYAASKPFTIEGRSYQPGALLLRTRGNPDELPEILDRHAHEVGIEVFGVNTGLADEGSDLGADTYRLLVQPRVAIAGGEGMDYNSFGSLWFTIDRQLEIPHSILSASQLGRMDLSAYNVIVLPSVWSGNLTYIAGPQVTDNLRGWIENGGTLICVDQAAVWAADSATGLSQVRLKRQALGMLDTYDLGLEHERNAEAPTVDTMAIWHPDKVKTVDSPEDKRPRADMTELEELDKWQRKFRPGGVIMQADLDLEDWLAYGMKDRVPVLVYTRHAFLSTSPVKTAARFAESKDLRMSGLLWPEARSRWANTACITHESKGKGQLVLFSNDPNIRAYFYGTRQMFLNAILYGPAMVRSASPYGQSGVN